MGRYDEALADYNRTIELDPDNNGYATEWTEIRKLMGLGDDAMPDQGLEPDS
jgi:tetratricopeptide (TPR) repeat protein